MIRGWRWALGLVALVVAGSVLAAAFLTNVPLRWKPTSDLRLGTLQMAQTSVQFDKFTDVRQDPHAIGENRENDTLRPVTTADDVGEFVGIHMRELFNKAGLTTVDNNGGVLIKGEIKDFFVRETSTYKAEVSVHLTIVGRGGTTLWSGTAPGEATRFGRSYNLENYYEVLSDAVVNATSSLLSSPEIQKALGQH
jgi:hypothetical protein